MGSCSNRPDTKQERLGKYAKKIAEASGSQSSWEENYEKFQFTTGAKIRGDLGIEKGNAFIKAIREASR